MAQVRLVDDKERNPHDMSQVPTADDIPSSGRVISPYEYEKQKLNDNTSIPNDPIRQTESRAQENESEGEFDTGLNEQVPQGEETKNIGKL